MALYELRENIPLLFEAIHRESEGIVVPENIQGVDLKRSYSLARVIDTYLESHFTDTTKVVLTAEQIKERIDQIFEECYNELVLALTSEKVRYRASLTNPNYNHSNLFEAAGAEELVLANKYTRVISENLGHKFEKIAALSSSVFNTKTKLGIALRGVDIVIYDGTRIRYTQLKTKMDTLTGSQVPRSNIELSIHQDSVFAAALALGSRWTFSNSGTNLHPVTRLAGADFWGVINLDYNYILQKSKDLIVRIEQHLYQRP